MEGKRGTSQKVSTPLVLEISFQIGGKQWLLIVNKRIQTIAKRNLFSIFTEKTNKNVD